MFIVLVTHSTGRGVVTNPMLLTEDVKIAVTTAREVEKYEYEFHGTEIGVGVYNLVPGRIYRKSDFDWYGDKPAGPSPIVVFYWSRFPGTRSFSWKEEWFDADSKKIVEGVRARY